MLFLVIAVVSVVALAAAGFRNGALRLEAVVSLAFVAYLSWFAVEALRRRVVRGALILSPHGIYHRSGSFDSFLPWDAAVSVTAGELDGQLITVTAYANAEPWIQRRSRMWKQPELKLAPHTAIRGMYLSVDPGLALTLRYYLDHADARQELATAQGVDRVRSGRVVVLR